MHKRLIAGLIIIPTIIFSTMLFASPVHTVEGTESTASMVSVTRDDGIVTHLTVEVADFEMQKVDFNSENLDRFTIGLEPRTVREGWPELPMITRTILVPPTAGIHLTVNEITSRIERGFNPVITVPQDGSFDLDGSGIPSDEYLNYDGFWPPDPVVISQPAILRGYRLVQVTIYPVQYNPSTGEMRFNDLVDYQLDYNGIGENIVINPSRPRPSSSIHRILESLVINPPTRDAGVADSDRGSYLLIYPDVNGVDEAIQPLVEWRARQGWEVHTAEVRNRAGTGTVKDIIEEAYEEWDRPPEMVALVGDAGNNEQVAISAYNQTDLDYVLLEGNDILADADIGRISVESVNQLRTVIAKIVNYEADPWMEDTDWYIQGMVCAGAQISGLSTILVNRWVKYELEERGFDDIHEWYYNAPYQGWSVPTFFSNEFQRGVAFSNYRGWVGIEGTSPGSIIGFRAHRRYPTVVLLTCSSGNYIDRFGHTEAFLRSAGGGNGAVGLCTNGTHVQYNNAISTGIWVGFLKEELYNFGTAVNRGRYELWRQYHNFDDGSVNNLSRWTNLMGDPATHIFTGIPRTIVVNHDDTLPLGGSRFSVSVFDEENETALPEALVCIYKADDEFQKVAYTNEDGTVEFNIPIDGLTNGELLVTVTKHNTVPYLGEAEVGEHEFFLGVSSLEVDDDNAGASRGDDDQIPNPGETIELRIDITNFGADTPEGAITISAESLSEYAEITSDPLQLNESPGVGESVTLVFALEIDGSAPDEAKISVAVDASDDETTWHSMAVPEVQAPRLVIQELDFIDGDFEPGDIRELDVEVSNIGRKTTGPFGATLHCLTDVVSLVRADAQYGNIEPGERATIEGDPFRIRSHPFAIPGMEVSLFMSIETEDQFRDTTDNYQFNIGSAGEGDPFGPDKYGYVCFDSFDEGWEMTPVYEWIEIDPDEREHDFEGEDTELRDNGDNSDQSMSMELPFNFKYYGEEFDRITICTNGWVAFGNWAELSDFRNRRIASGGGPNAQLCVFWDNLRTGKVLTFYDAEMGRFIVEWNDMQRLADGINETFELILYDPQRHPTYSGDGVIVFQYADVRNGAGPGRNDTPYCTIGIGNLDDTDGLEYTYWNRFHPAAEPLQNELAIKFTTATEFITGVLTGTVRDAESGELIPNAQITTSRGFWDESDEEGIYFIDEILIGDNYIVSAYAQGFNDSTWAGEEGNGISIAEDETLTVDFNLLHPEFNIDRDGFRFQMNAEDTLRERIILSNDGNGMLEYTSRFTYVLDDFGEGSPGDRGIGPFRQLNRDDPDDQWDPLLVWTAGDSVDDTKIQGITFVQDHWIVSGGGSGREDENWFYVFDRWGQFVERFPQPIGDSRYGLRDMEYYNGYLYCTYPDENLILKVDPATGEEITRWSTPGRLRTITNLTIDPEGYLWVSSITSDLYKLEMLRDSALVEVQSFRTRDPRDNDTRIRTGGLAWFRDDPDQYHVYMISNNAPLEEDDPEGVLPNISVYKLNPFTGDIRFLTHLPSFDQGSSGRGGLCITPKWNNLVWAMAAVIDNSNADMFGVMELAPNSSWIDYNPRNDTLFSGEVETIEIMINTADLDTGSYGVVIEFSHNSAGGITDVPVDLIITTLGALDLTGMPLEYSLKQNYPNPFNSSTVIEYSLEQPGFTRLTIFDMLGREIKTLVDDRQQAARYRFMLDAGGLPAGIYLYRLKSGSYTSVHKMLLLK